jgi:hypothetical protein
MSTTGRFIQLLPAGRNQDGDTIYALADDGEVWFGSFIDGDPGDGLKEIRWRKVPSGRAS